MSIYLLLFIAVLVCEFSPYMDTKNIIKKLALGLIGVGAMLDLANKPNLLIEIGALAFFATCAIRTWYADYRLTKSAKLKMKG